VRKGGSMTSSNANPAARSPAPDAPVVTLSNPDKVLYPRDRITKADLAAYYAAIAPYMLPTLRDRPLAFQQWPKGIDQPQVFRQGVTHAPEWLETVETQSRTRSTAPKHPLANRP